MDTDFSIGAMTVEDVERDDTLLFLNNSWVEYDLGGAYRTLRFEALYDPESSRRPQVDLIVTDQAAGRTLYEQTYEPGLKERVFVDVTGVVTLRIATVKATGACCPVIGLVDAEIAPS
ncbi:MAG: hypothetical protein AAF467_21140 [Actinomycetota bacterium]